MKSQVAASKGTHERGASILELLIVVVVGLVITAITAKAMFSAVNTYRVSTAGTQIAGTLQVAKIKASARDTRYRVTVYGNTFRLERYNRTSNAWELDAAAANIPLPPGVTFSATSPISITAPPPEMGSTVTQATDMTFNTRAMLVDNSGNPVDSRCFYVQGSTLRPVAVCSTVVGKIVVSRLNGSTTWERLQ